MQNTIYHPQAHSLNVTHKISLKGFFTWCAQQETNRLLWLAIALLVQSCVLVPVSLFALFAAGIDVMYWIFPTLAMSMCLVVNLAALPTKITIPVFILSIILDLVIIAGCFL